MTFMVTIIFLLIIASFHNFIFILYSPKKAQTRQVNNRFLILIIHKMDYIEKKKKKKKKNKIKILIIKKIVYFFN